MTQEQAAYIRAHWATTGDSELARTLGLHRSTVYRFRVKHDLVAHDGKDPVVYENSLEVPYIATLDDLLKVMQVPEGWEVTKFRVNAWGRDAQNHQVRAELSKSATATIEALREGLLEDLRTTPHGTSGLRQYPQDPRASLKEISIADLHLGKKGPGYDTDMAEALFRAAVYDLVQKSSGIPTARFLLPVSNDFLHADNQKHQTTSGTPMDIDVFYVDMFRRGWRLLRWAIEYLLEIAPVDVVVVPGNHDGESGFAMGELLYALYEDHPNVTVDNRPLERKYYSFGKTLLGFTHGHAGKLPELPLYMADEAPDLWAACPYREWHLGHKHRKREHRWVSQDELRGVRVREVPSLSGTDRWHYREGYNHWRAAEMYVWDPETSFTALFSFNPAGSGHAYKEL